MERLFVLSCVVVLSGFMGLTTQAVVGNGAIINPPPLLQGTPPADQRQQFVPPVEPFSGAIVATDLDSIELPTAISQTENQVPFPDVQQVAMRNAQALWGNVVQGPVVPYCDSQGRISAYAFVFRIGKDPFPRYGSAIRENATTTKNGTSLYTTMLVSASYDAPPIPAYGYGLSPFYLKGLSSLTIARKQLRTWDLHLNRIYCLGTPLDLWFEFRGESESDRIAVDPYRGIIKTASEFKSYLDALPMKNMNASPGKFLKTRGEWEKFIKGKTLSSIPSNHFFSPYYNYVPFYDWNYGCSPTSSAMLLAWYRYYYINFGLLNLYYFERHFDPPPNNNEYHVAIAQQGLAMCMNTDTLLDTNHGNTRLDSIGPGIVSYTAPCRTPFTTSSIGPDTNNYFHWPDITSEIAAGRPFIWSVHPVNGGGHSLCAVGYTDDGYVIVHDTWDNTLWGWLYNAWDWVHIVKVYYGSFLSQDVDLTSPHGGLGYRDTSVNAETWQAGTTHNITWNANGSSHGTVSLGYSVDGALTWYQIALNRPNSGQYSWTVPNMLATNHARVLIELFDSTSQFTGCDGSYGNFNISPSGVEENFAVSQPSSFRMSYWSPNPFVSSSAIAFDLPATAPLSMKLYDVTGRVVKALPSATFNQGHHVLRWDGKDSYGKLLPAGIYFARMDLGGNAFTQKLILTR